MGVHGLRCIKDLTLSLPRNLARHIRVVEEAEQVHGALDDFVAPEDVGLVVDKTQGHHCPPATRPGDRQGEHWDGLERRMTVSTLRPMML